MVTEAMAAAEMAAATAAGAMVTAEMAAATAAGAMVTEAMAAATDQSAEPITTDLRIIQELRNQRAKVMKREPAKEADATETAQPQVTKDSSLDRSETDNGSGSI
jgi:hypothetical protein